MEIRILHRQGKSIRSIATELSISRETVRKYLRSPGLEPGYGPRAARGSKLDPFKAYTRQRLRDAAPRRLPGTVLLRELRERGYEGGISILKDWLAKERPAPAAPEIKRFETAPAHQAQIDWTTIRRGQDRLSAFVATLGFSRWSFFDAIGGTPRTILFDNMKTVLIDRDAFGPGRHRFHAGFRV